MPKIVNNLPAVVAGAQREVVENVIAELGEVRARIELLRVHHLRMRAQHLDEAVDVDEDLQLVRRRRAVLNSQHLFANECAQVLSEF